MEYLKCANRVCLLVEIVHLVQRASIVYLETIDISVELAVCVIRDTTILVIWFVYHALIIVITVHHLLNVVVVE